GHTFNGWFTASTGGSKVTFPYTVGAADVTLYAQYTANKYVLSYDVATNGATSTKPADEQVTFDTLATKPADAVKTGYTFVGWFDAATGGTQWNFATSKMPANAVKLYAQFTINSYTMTFDNDGATTTQTVVYDTLATEPTAPTKTGFTFAGWFDAQTGGTKWNFTTNKMPASNKTLYAQYTRNNYTLTFNDQGTTTTQTVAFDALVVEPATVPTKSGYTFSGWFDAATGGTKWNFATNKMPASNKTLYAQFTADDQNITFDANGGSGAPATLTQPTDSSVNLDALTNPTRAGYSFVG
ncbi:InlB B-repeat-containing protein, partial [Culicoidibacter larvae]